MQESPSHVNHILNRLWRFRKQRQLSQRDVALLMGHQEITQVSRWENGESVPTLRNALLLGNILKTPVEELFADLAAALRAEVEGRAAKREESRRQSTRVADEIKTKTK